MTRMLYLHGFAGCVDHVGGSKDVVAAMNLADEMIAFNAPFPVDGGGYKWFSLPGDNISGADINAEMKESAEFIASRIGPEPIDIIFGTSQGGFMALYLTLKNIIRAQRTIAAVPFYIPGLIGADMNKDTPILWMAAGTDEVIPPDVGGVWQNLIAAGANLEYKIDDASAHAPDTWSPAFKNAIIEWSKK